MTPRRRGPAWYSLSAQDGIVLGMTNTTLRALGALLTIALLTACSGGTIAGPDRVPTVIPKVCCDSIPVLKKP